MTTEATNIDDSARLEIIDPAQVAGSGPDAGDPPNHPDSPPFRPVHLPEGLLAGHDFPPLPCKQRGG